MRGEESYNSMFLVWWYAEVRQRLFLFARQFLFYLTDLFSVKICIFTLFAPWKRDKVSYSGLTFQAKFQVWIWNLVSRFVGATVKLFTLISYLVSVFFYFVFGIIVFCLWLFFPFLIILLIIYGFRIMLL